ncbi:MAG: hypothetical protein ACTHJ3_00040 [Pararhizobium sp.]
MATIIRLADRRPKKTPARRDPAGGGATILIFSGVRYGARQAASRRRSAAEGGKQA